ncbi:MAG: hypothetical protein WD003_02225 [Candidatus Paceibacterota bacterium]
MDKNSATIKEFIKKLPQDIQTAAASTEVFDALEKIGKRHNLHVDALGGLVDETTFVILGLTHPNEFISNLAKRIGVEREKARAIAEDVNKEVFHPIRESLKEIHSLKKERRENQPLPSERESEDAYQVPLPKRKIPVKHEIKKGMEERVEPELEKEKSGLENKAPEPLVVTPKKNEPLDPRGEEGSFEGEENVIIPDRLRDIKIQSNVGEEEKEVQDIESQKKVLVKINKEKPPLNLPIKKEGRGLQAPSAREEKQTDTPQESKEEAPPQTQKEETPRAPTPQPKKAPSEHADEEGQVSQEKKPDKKEYAADPYREPIE